VFDVNFWGMAHDCEAALPHLKRHGGVLVNVTSVTSNQTSQLSRNAHKEHRPTAIAFMRAYRSAVGNGNLTGK
jgi:NAD(P)-dependent dehydrogenase (short-subunit alcohol dehydrogenase family)